jgi:hypothetical protein
MPALGYTITEAVVQIDHDALASDEFARAYLNRRQGGGPPVIDAGTWAACLDPHSQLTGLPCFAVDVTPDRAWGAIGVAGWRGNHSTHVEVVAHQPGTDWIVPRLTDLVKRWRPWPVVIDPASPAGSLLIDLASLGIPTDTVTARDYAAACGQLFDAVIGRQLVHLDQPVLSQAVAAARKRVLGDAWAWGRRTGGDVCALVAITLARYGLMKGGDSEFRIF